MINFNVKQGNNPLFALSCLHAGLKMLTHSELRKYLLMPLLINIILYSGAFAVSYYGLSGLAQSLIPAWLSWLQWILWPLFFLCFLLITFFTFTLLANLIAAPYYNALSAKTLNIISGETLEIAELPWNKVFLAELNRIGYLLIRIIPISLLFLIPVVNFVAPLLWALFVIWGASLEYLAYPLENRGVLFTDQKEFLRQNRLGVLGFGGIASLGLSLPVINLFAGQVAVIAATIYVHRLSVNTDEVDNA